MNILQSCSFLFIVWSVATFGQFSSKITNEYTNLSYIFLIIGFIIYAVLQEYLAIIALKWLTVISSIEMKRDDKCVKKLINNQAKAASKMSNEIYTSFKKIYFDTKCKAKARDEDNEFKLNYSNLRDFISVNFKRFPKQKRDAINIKDELRPFLKTCGNILTNEEIEFMLYLLPDAENYNGDLTLQQLYDICGVLMYFREKKTSEIIKFVFDNYYKENSKIFRDVEMNWENIEVFLETYQKYFNKKQIKFIKDECNYIGNNFTLDGFIGIIFTPSQYYPF